MLSRENFERLRKRGTRIAAGLLHAYSAEIGGKQLTLRQAEAAAPACVGHVSLVAPAHAADAAQQQKQQQQQQRDEEEGWAPRDEAPRPVLRPLSFIDLELMSHCYDIDWSLVFSRQVDVARLRDAISRALDTYPSLAGRVVAPGLQGKSPSLVLGRQPKDVALRIGGERQGVWLTVVEVPLPLPRSIAEGQPRQLKGLICDEDGPMFVHKVNRDFAVSHFTVLQFQGAGILNMRISHCIVDGTAFGDFVAHLAACYTHAPLAPSPTVKPCEDRIEFDLRSGLPPESRVRNYKPNNFAYALVEDFGRYLTCNRKGIEKYRSMVSPLGGITGYMPLGQVLQTVLRGLSDPTTGIFAPGPVHMVRLIFDRAQLKRLKEETISTAAAAMPGVEPGAAERLSTNDAVSALIWKAVEENRRWRGTFDATTDERKLFIPVNTRGRLSPPMPEVFGNAVVIAVAKLDVQRLKEGSLGEVALNLRKCKAGLTPAGIEAESRFAWEHVRSGRFLRWSMDTFRGGLLISDWTKFRFASEGGGLFGDEKPHFDPVLAGGFRLPYFGIVYDAHDGRGLVADISVPDDERAAFLASIAKHAAPRVL